MHTLVSLALFAASAAAAIPYQQYILAPSSRTVRPVSIFRQHGSLSSPTALLDAKHSGNGLVLDAFNSSVTYDFGKNIGGWVNLDLSSASGSIGVTFSESSLWVSSEACDATADAGLDAPLVFNITQAGHYEAPSDKERGAFRYLTVVNLGTDKITLKDLWVHFTAMPHWDDDALRNYSGWFHSNDEQINRIWYAGAYTNQLVTIDPTRGDSLQSLGNVTDTTVNWALNTTITGGLSTLTDGAKRDRLVWSGDMAIAVPGIAVTTFDLISIRNALDSLFALQAANGQLPYAGFPFNERGFVSFTYHLYALIGVANFYLWSGDAAYRAAEWPAWKLGMQWATQQIDSTGLANVTAPNDWLRFGMGGHNIEANAILFYTLNLGVALARDEGDAATAASYIQLANKIQEVAVPLLWQPTVGLFRDNETTTLAPQDGNAWAVKSGLVPSSSSQLATISHALEARWGPYGAPAPEAADAVSPFISGFELEAHFMAGRADAALALVRRMWGDFMLDDPRMTNSTFIEGYSVTGALHYAPYKNDARISYAHGWATGPTSALTTFVGGIQILTDAGATWAVVPQPGDLTRVDTGFSTPKGKFSSKWTRTNHTFTLTISTPKGTSGRVGIPLPGTHNSSLLTGAPGKAPAVVHGDSAGVHWVENVKGGDYVFVAAGL
ncbi:bacterial alpha-L-rhamnosidase domain protein [Trametes versicolor FP-101664 SS1]|uniref:bacterial alpha-L-rhamnosidase domain protein n=1 Tax=Trametes versicolor (strain FP-101664) TaxID=717944 RepID=UPI0004621AD5|nr:bacterial alpha-L-rhamnosidase domain protein [Trametes versicolor FP-101664 SS1]EIW64903.1 bacterial alpha-L-rhamnosidase domain protein [Trametes versicolor FP-101664 SS1]